jgi:TonB family protein
MSCLWPRKRGQVAGAGASVTLRALMCFLLVLISFVASNSRLGWSSVIQPARVGSYGTSASKLDPTLRRGSAHIAESAPIDAILATSACESVRPAEALLTPDPLVLPEHEGILVRVSFIIGSDGHVHSAFILYSGGAKEDAVVLEAVRGWRFRPALCNGVPMDSEARVRFTIPE